MTSRAKSSARGKAAVAPKTIQIEPIPIVMTFRLRDCEFVEFQRTFDKNVSTVYDMMSAIAEKHGNTVPTDKVTIYQKIADGSLKPITEFTQPLSEIEATNFYYDFEPVSGSLLIFTNKSPNII